MGQIKGPKKSCGYRRKKNSINGNEKICARGHFYNVDSPGILRQNLRNQFFLLSFELGNNYKHSIEHYKFTLQTFSFTIFFAIHQYRIFCSLSASKSGMQHESLIKDAFHLFLISLIKELPQVLTKGKINFHYDHRVRDSEALSWVEDSEQAEGFLLKISKP